MRNVFEEYRQGLISWDEAFFIANNSAAASTMDTDYWADQMESLGVDAAVQIMELIGYESDSEGIYKRPQNDKSEILHLSLTSLRQKQLENGIINEQA